MPTKRKKDEKGGTLGRNASAKSFKNSLVATMDVKFLNNKDKS